MLKWLFRRRAEEAPMAEDASRADSVPDGRLGPEPPPPPTANRPGVTVHAATAVTTVDRPAAGPCTSKVGPAGTTPLGRELAWTAVVLSGEGRGDVVMAPDGGIDLPSETAALFEGAPAGARGAPLLIPRDGLGGQGIPGITGARVLAKTESHSVLRFGPPPAARWAVVGLRSVAVFTGKLTLFDGDEGRDVWAGQVAIVADPTATLYIQAGNDTAVAIALAEPEVLVRLG
ncbi:MAG: hypothetical protein IPL90_01225 [Holophagales bacterium]|nr:hypothetical protein [Holophagales bacterium]